MTPLHVIQLVAVFFFAVVLHEYAHGWVAYKLGDSTAKSAGRLTLNPLKHIDPIGTVALPAMLFLLARVAGASPIIFGWAKPVPVNFANLRRPKKDMMWVGIAGPAANIAVALVCSQLLRLATTPSVAYFLELAVFINLLLAIFNLIPIPPLDGSRLVMGLLPNRYAYRYAQVERYGMFVILLVLLPLGVFQKVVLPLVVICAYYLGVR